MGEYPNDGPPGYHYTDQSVQGHLTSFEGSIRMQEWTNLQIGLEGVFMGLGATPPPPPHHPDIISGFWCLGDLA